MDTSLTMTNKKHWPIVKFGDVVRQVKDKVDVESSGLDRYVAGEHMNTDDLRIRSWGTIDDGYLGPAFTMRFKPGQVLYGSRRTYLRKVAVADFEGICANTTFVLEPKDSTALLPELLPFIMQTESFHDHSIKQSKGSVNPYVNFSDLAWYEFALPPMEEQRRIAEVLSAYHNLQVALDNVKHSLNALFSPFLDRLVEVRPKSEKVLLGKVVKIHIDKVNLESDKTYQMSGVLGFGQGLFPNGKVDTRSTKYKFLHRLSTDQLVLRKITAWESPIAIVTPEYDGTFVSPEFPTFRLNQSRILPSYMSILYRTPTFTREMQSRCTGTLVRRMRLNPKELLSIPIVLPPIDEQQYIVDKFDAFLDGLKKIENRIELLKSAQTKQLQQCFIERETLHPV